MMHEIESASERICQYDQMLESTARNRYPDAEWLKQIKGVGTLIALSYMLTLEDPHCFRKSRDSAYYVGLKPGRRNSRQSEPQLHISKEGDPYLRALSAGCPSCARSVGGDSDLRRWGMKLAEHGGKRGKKRAVIATARKLTVLCPYSALAETGMCRYGQVAKPRWRQWHSSVQIYGGLPSYAEFR
jgi:transposase